jgi:hypothetical protein
MALDSRFILASDLLSAFFDKDSGEPLSNGVITFYKDQARTEAKGVYQISGTPPNYIYTPLGNVITLSATGLMQNPDTGEIIVLMYFPLEGTPDETNGTVELYYVTCYNEDGELQWTREGWPNYTNTNSVQVDFTNYAPNGQFLFHNNVPLLNTTDDTGEITQAITTVAQGGWTFERPGGSTATDIVLFEAFNSFQTNPSASPQYRIRISTEISSAGDAFKDLRLKFTDVNKFASATQKYTFAFTGQSNTGSSLSVSLVLIKNYGSGGSTTTETTVANLVIPASYAIVSTTGGFVFGSNAAKTIGDGSYLQLAIRFPTGSIFDVSLTDVILTPEATTIEAFPQTTDGQFSNQALIAPKPNPDGSDLYLPLLSSPAGLVYDRTIIGKVFPAVYLTPGIGELNCDGAKYETAAYSTDGIPYSRLQAKLFNTTTNIPNFGTGASYLTAYVNNVTTNLRIATNTTGAVTVSADFNTGFTITTQHTGADYGTSAFVTSLSLVYIFTNAFGATTAPSAGTSGFTVNEQRIGAVDQAQFAEVITIAAAGLAGLYFLYSNTTTDYYIWFTVDGAGADPAVGGRTGIKIDLLSTYDSVTVAAMIAEALSGNQITNVVCGDASTLTAGHYFNIFTATTQFYVWYQINGAGTDPAPSGKVGIPVNVASTDTAAQVVTKTQTAINSKYFAVPDLRGMFIRGFDASGINDPESGERYSPYGAFLGTVIGQRQTDEIRRHTHPLSNNSAVLRNTGSGDQLIDSGSNGIDANLIIDYTGTYETRPINTSLNYIIKY